MKKILLIASFLCTVFILSAQQIYVQGIVTDSSGNGVPNATVVISNPILGGGMAVGWSQTDANGSYWWLDSINTFSLSQPGFVDVSIADCNGTIFSQSLAYTPNLLSLTANFSPICVGNPIGNNCSINIPLPFVGNGAVSISANGTGGIAPYSYHWDMGDGSTYTSQTANHNYAANGIYSICVTVIDATGCLVTQCTNVTITGATGGNNCSASLFSNQDTTNYLTYNFTSNSTGATFPLTYLWDFGDGNTSTFSSPTHTYNTSGTYTACVTITDANGCTSTDCVQLSIFNNPSCTSFFTTIPDVNNPYNFGFIMPNGPNNSLEIWSYGDGTVDSLFALGATGHTYSATGTYLVCLTEVNLTNGCVSSYCDTVVVGTIVSCQTTMQYANTPDSLNVDFSSSSTGVGPFTYHWDFGDGNTSTIQNPSHIYSNPGTYTVCITITDANGCASTDCMNITVTTPQNCDATFTTAQLSGGGFAFLPSITNNSTIYLWDFGDGNFDTSNISPTHTYAQSGFYSPCLTTIDLMTGCIDTYCDSLFAVGTPTPCQASIQYVNLPGSMNVDFIGSSTGTAPFTYAWDFGDGNTSILQNPSHLYSTVATGPVSFIVTLVVTDGTGCTSTVTQQITVFGGNSNGQITGYLWKDTFNFIPADGLVYLIEYDSTNGSLTAIDTVQTQQGLFNFINVPAGDYLVKAALEPTDPDYANYLPTYFVQSLSWNTAQYIGPAPFGVVFIDIQLVAGNNPGGPGFIGGLVVNGAGRPVNGNQTLVENIENMEPIEGASVLLLDANGNAVTHTTTDETGAYSFNGIAMGTYNVHVEEVGKVTFPATVVIDANNKSHTEIHFTVHESMVTLTGVYEVSNIEGLSVFPNPVNDAATVQIELTEAMNLTLTVTNLMGQEIINTNKNLFAGENTFSVEMNDLPTGLYLMSLKSGSDVVTYKIQKN